jgi:S-adenosylmethionine hydrolase
VAATFHGRDVFAPVAAHLANGTPLGDAGEPLAPDELVGLELPGPRVSEDGVTVTVLGVDGYGNVQLSATHEELAGTPLRLGAALTVRDRPARMARTFADTAAGELLVYEDAWRCLALAVNRGDAAAELALAPGDELTIAVAR